MSKPRTKCPHCDSTTIQPLANYGSGYVTCFCGGCTRTFGWDGEAAMILAKAPENCPKCGSEITRQGSPHCETIKAQWECVCGGMVLEKFE